MTGDDMKSFKASLTNTGWVVSYMPSPINDPDVTIVESSLSPNASENLFIWTRWDHVTYHATLFFSVKNSSDLWSAA